MGYRLRAAARARPPAGGQPQLRVLEAAGSLSGHHARQGIP
nr:hypothetical protein [Pseudarthrobacter sp. BIM B-2242]